MKRLLRWFCWLPPALFALSHLSASPMIVFIGTYTRATSRGIYALRFDPADGSLSEPWLAGEARNPTFLALDPSGNHLYAAGELRLDPPAKTGTGGVSAFAVEPGTGRLSFLNQQPTGGGGTCHVVVDATGRMAIAANYGSAYVCALPIAADGSLGAPSAHFSHAGPLGPNRDRQDRAHAHSVTLSPDNRFALVCDLGLDRVYVYRLDPAAAALAPNEPPFASAPPGSGPRHSKFSADGRFLYVANELASTVCVFAFDAARGTLALRQTLSTLPPDFPDPGASTVAEIRLHPNGRFVYVSNRGHDSVAVFARDPESGLLGSVEIVPCGGKHPRNFALTPDGRWLLCANRDSGDLVVFHVDPATGRLRPSGRWAPVPEPVCVLISNSPGVAAALR